MSYRVLPVEINQREVTHHLKGEKDQVDKDWESSRGKQVNIQEDQRNVDEFLEKTLVIIDKHVVPPAYFKVFYYCF